MSTRAAADRAGFAVAPGVLLAGMAGGLAFPILPTIGIEHGMPVFAIGAILAANRFSRIVAGPLVGSAADRLGTRSLMLGGLLGQVAVMALYRLALGSSHTALLFFAGRLLHGPCAAAVFVGAQALALRAGGQEHGGLAAGTVKAAMSLGLPLGVLLGGALLPRLGAAHVFDASMVALVLATGAALLATPRQEPVARRAPFKEVLGALANRRVAALGALNFAVTFSAMGVVLTALPIVVHGRAALLMGVVIVAMGAATLLSSRLARTPRAHAFVSTASVSALPVALLLLAFPATTTIGALVLGLGAGALSSSVVSQLNASLEDAHVGAASGWLQLCGDVGGVLGPLAASALLGFGPAATFTVSAALTVGFVPVALWLVPERGGHAAHLAHPAKVNAAMRAWVLEKLAR